MVSCQSIVTTKGKGFCGSRACFFFPSKDQAGNQAGYGNGLDGFDFVGVSRWKAVFSTLAQVYWEGGGGIFACYLSIIVFRVGMYNKKSARGIPDGETEGTRILINTTPFLVFFFIES